MSVMANIYTSAFSLRPYHPALANSALADYHRGMNHAKLTSLFFPILALVFLLSCADDNKSFTVSGTIETDDIDLIAPFSAELLEIRYAEGAIAQAGDTLAILDTTLVVAALSAAQAAVDESGSRLADLQAGSDIEKIRAAEARLEQARASAKQAKADLARATKLHQQDLLDDRSFEQAQLLNTNSSQAITVAEQALADLNRGARIDQIAAAQSALRRAEAEYASRNKSYRDAFLVSRHKGVVQILPYQVGERIPVGRPVVTLRDPENLWIKIYVPESDLDAVEIDASLSFSVDAYPAREFAGRVVFISNTAEFTPRNVQSPEERVNLVFAVKVAVVSGHQNLRAGMPADFTLK
jgi:membrane fusion protein YbhG